MDIFQHAGQFFANAGLLLSSFLGNHHGAVLGQSIKPTIESQNVSSDSYYKATRSVSYDGYTINLSIAVPKNGGAITGSLSGDCTGKITGTYAGGNNGVINGQLEGTCQALFLQIPIHATFTGPVNTDTKTAHLEMTITVESVQKTEPVIVSFN